MQNARYFFPILTKFGMPVYIFTAVPTIKCHVISWNMLTDGWTWRR